MTRSEPLTVLALGRSPYDEVMQGEGEGDPRAPVQMYDERGRPVNPEAKRLNRDLIRAHNEVMLAIGVAEPDDAAGERLEAAIKDVRMKEANVIGSRLWNLGRVVEIAGVWGLHGLRNRILVYKQYSQIPFADLYHHEMSRRSILSFCLSGFPSFIAETVLRLFSLLPPSISHNNWVRIGVQYIRLHLQLFIFMQRTELVSPNAWLPGLKYFIPFSSSSPIAPPPSLCSLCPYSILRWIGDFAVGLAPVAAFWLYLRVTSITRERLWPLIYARLPSPYNGRSPFERQMTLPPPGTSRPATAAARRRPSDGAQTNSIGGPVAEDSTQPGAAGQSSIAGENSARGVGEPTPAVQTIRRQSTFSARGAAGAEDYASDEEEIDGVTATLISFDVEATEPTDAPPGDWSAELRPNMSPQRDAGGAMTIPQAGLQPLYEDNALTRLPARLAADIMTIVTANILMVPFEAFALRAFARAIRRRRGLSVLDLHLPSPWKGVTWNLVGNFLQLEMVHFLIQGELWAIMKLLADIVAEEPDDGAPTAEG